MAVTIVGTLEMIYTSGGDTVSEPLNIDMASPTEQPLKLQTGLVFTDPAVDVRTSLETYLTATYGFTSITRVVTPRAGALAEWTAVKGGITRAVVLWQSLPLKQVGVVLGQTVAGDTGTTGRGYESVEIGEDASAGGKHSVAVGKGTTVAEAATDALAFGTDATASGVSSMAVGTRAAATEFNALAVGTDAAAGVRSTAIGVDSDAMGMESTAIGQGATSSAMFSTAVGRNATAAETDATAVGNNAQSTAHSTVSVGKSARSEASSSLSIGAQSNTRGEGGAAIGAYSFVSSSHPRAVSIGYSQSSFAPDTTAIAAKSLVLQPHSLAGTLASELALQDTTGTLHTIGATPGALTYDGVKIGQVLTFSANASPGAENTTTVGTYATSAVLRSQTLQAMIPAITTGLWDVDVVATAVVYRSVATGGVFVYVGNGTAAISQALGRLAPQTHAYTLTLFTSPNVGLAAVGPTQIIDVRYTGFSTAGTTFVVSHGWQITARRVG